MAGPSGKDWGQEKLGIDAAMLSVHKLKTSMEELASLQRRQRPVGALAGLKPGFAKAVQTDIKSLVDAMKSGQATIDVSAVKIEDDFLGMLKAAGAVSERGGKGVINLKKALGAAVTLIPGSFAKSGEDINEVAARSAQWAQRTDKEFVLGQQIRRGAVRATLNTVLSTAEASKVSEDDLTTMMRHGAEGNISDAKNVMDQEIAQGVKKEDAQEAAQKKIRNAIRSSKMLEMGFEQKLDAQAASRSVGSIARETAEGKTAGSSVFSKLGWVRKLAAVEEDVSNARLAGEKKSLTSSQQAGLAGVHALVGIADVVGKLSAAIMPMTSLFGLVMQIVGGFDRAKKSGAGLSEVISAGRTLPGGGFFGIDLQKNAAAMQSRIYAIRKEAGFTAAVNFDNLAISALSAAKSFGGVADKEVDIADGLIRIQAMAPVAGLDAAEALRLAASGHRAFGFEGRKDVVNYFNTMRVGARNAKLSVGDFIQSANIENLGLIWGETAESMSKTMSDLVSGAGESPGARMLAAGALASLGTADIGKMLAFRMAPGGGAGSFGQAVSGLSAPGGLAGQVGSFRGMAKELGLTGAGGPEEKGKMAIFLQSQFGQAVAMKALTSETFRNNLFNAKTDSQFGKLVDEANKEDPLRQGAQIASNQLDTLEQIRILLEENLQMIFKLIANPLSGLTGSLANEVEQNRVGRAMRRALPGGRAEG